MTPEPIALGWRVHTWWAVMVAVTGSAASPVVVAREEVTLLDDASVREPYHAAAGVPIGEAQALIDSVAEAAAVAAEASIRAFAASLGRVVAVGVVGGDGRAPKELPVIFSKHALQHAYDRDVYEQAVIEGAARAGLPVATIPLGKATIDHASRVLGVALEPALAALGESVGRPWQKDQREATAAALVALATSASTPRSE